MELTLCGAAIHPVSGAVSPLSFFWKWVLLGGAASPTSSFLEGGAASSPTLIGGAVFLPLAMGVLLPALGWCCFVDWPLGRPGGWPLWKVKDIGKSKNPRASGVVGSLGCWFFLLSMELCFLLLGPLRCHCL